MLDDIENAAALNLHQNFFKTDSSYALKHLIFFVTPIKVTHIVILATCVPFVNNLQFYNNKFAIGNKHLVRKRHGKLF